MESFTGIQLKTLLYWLISENRLKNELKAGNKRRSAIVITVKEKSEAKYLCTSGFRFEKIVKAVEKYWEARSSLVYMTCCGISHKRIESCENRLLLCIICTGSHKVVDHNCGVANYNKKKRKICIYVAIKCPNYRRNHIANFPRYILRHKVDIKA